MTPSEMPKLAALTPNLGGLDRDALLFEAGRAAGRRGPFWKLAALALAGTQTATIGAWLLASRPAPAPGPPPTPAVPADPPPAPPSAPPPSPQPAQTDEQWLDAMLNRFRPPEPPLSVARGPVRQSPPLTPRSDPRAVLMQ